MEFVVINRVIVPGVGLLQSGQRVTEDQFSQFHWRWLQSEGHVSSVESIEQQAEEVPAVVAPAEESKPERSGKRK